MNQTLREFHLAYSMRFVRSIILSTAFLYGFVGISRYLANDGTGVHICALRIGIVIFIMSVYAITFTKMYRDHHEVFMAMYVIVNSIVLMMMGIVAGGVLDQMSNPLILMPAAMIMLVLNYVLPMRFNYAVASGMCVSTPYMALALCDGTVNTIMTTFMMLSTINVLLALNSYSNENMIRELWGSRFK